MTLKVTQNIHNENAALRDLYAKALHAREKAYSPYSHAKVGAAVRTSDGSIFSGCNIENSSYGATNCAERVAIQNAISEKGHTLITEVLVITDATPPWPPCGLCRQVMSEFGAECRVYLTNLQGHFHSKRFSELFPNAFTPAHLV